MAVEPYNARNNGSHQENSDNWKSLGDLSEGLLERYLSETVLFCPNDNVELETFYNLITSIDTLRPSVIFHLARVARDQEHFGDLVGQAGIAALVPDEAEVIASCVIDEALRNGASPQDADRIWELFLIAAGHAMTDDDWVEGREMCKRIAGVST